MFHKRSENRFSPHSLGYLFATTLVVACLSSCQTEGPRVGSQTNWLEACDTSSECGSLKCICGTCTLECESDAGDCSAVGQGTCVAPTEPGAISLCDGHSPSQAMCLLTCEDDDCPTGTSCRAGVCTPQAAPTASVSIDPSQRYQALVGFGAGLADSEDSIVARADRTALLDAMFSDSGFRVVRVLNRFDGTNAADLATTDEILSDATARIGGRPLVFLSSDSPPASLKENGSRVCGSYDLGCTLSRDGSGAFDYAGFAEHWRVSLEAYETAGIVPDYFSIQGNADWLPEGIEAAACRFLPQEGTTTVTLEDGQEVEAEFAGYVQALAAVQSVVDLPAESFAAPESGSTAMVSPYTSALDPSSYGTIAFHMYLEEAIGGTRDNLEGIRTISEDIARPVFQSEMAEDGLNTAVLTHHTLATAGGVGYLHRRFIGDASQEDLSLILADEDGFELLPPYHALTHFSRNTGPGWLRIEASIDDADLLASAWLAPDESKLTLVFVNPTDSKIVTQVDTPDEWLPSMATATVTRTVFDGEERSADLGTLSEELVVQIPARAIVTVAASAD